MANWSLKVNVTENAMNLKRQGGYRGEGQRESVQENVDTNPRCSPVTLTAPCTLSFLSHLPPVTLPLCAEDSNLAIQHLDICPFGIES